MNAKLTPVRAFALLSLAGGLSACAQFPELDAVTSPSVATAPYPDLLPLGQLIDGPMPEASAETIARVEGRLGALQARADRLRRAGSAPAGVDNRLARLRQRAADLRKE